jgi:hypothetical protein
LCFVKIDASYGSIMLLKSVYQCAHTVIPKLNGGRVKGDENPWSEDY